MPKDQQEYEVGYRKPPKSGQFAKGNSGNPNRSAKGFEESRRHCLAGESPASSGERSARHPHGHETGGDGDAIGE